MPSPVAVAAAAAADGGEPKLPVHRLLRLGQRPLELQRHLAIELDALRVPEVRCAQALVCPHLSCVLWIFRVSHACASEFLGSALFAKYL